MTDSRHPSHPPAEDRSLVKARFLAALDLPAAEQETYLADLDRREPAVARRVRRLLDAHREAGTFLDVPNDDLEAVAAYWSAFRGWRRASSATEQALAIDEAALKKQGVTESTRYDITFTLSD